jgi:GNAT superfamily N-acetyltransferase
MTVRLLNSSDVPAAFELSTATGWNQTAADWRRMVDLEPDGCFGIEQDGRLVATTTLMCYGTDLAWIGMVLTHRDYQRRGLARKLVAAAVDEARGRGVRCVKLDATDQGRHLYASLGFIDEQPIERWRAGGWPELPEVPDPRLGPVPLALDRQAFGTDRSSFLDTVSPLACVDDEAYCLSRPGRLDHYLGPCVATRPETALRVISAALAEGPWFWDLLPGNTAARMTAGGLGFRPVRRLMRMRLGQHLQTRDDWMFAIAGFEAG